MKNPEILHDDEIPAAWFCFWPENVIPIEHGRELRLQQFMDEVDAWMQEVCGMPK